MYVRRRAAVVFAFGLIFSTLGALNDRSSYAQSTPELKQGLSDEKSKRNVRIIADEKGRHLVAIRWAPGRSDAVGELRFPVEYVWQANGVPIGILDGKFLQPDAVGPYMEGFILEALLPGFEARTAQNADRFKDGISGETIKIAVSVAPPIARGGGPIIDSHFQTRLRIIQYGLNGPVDHFSFRNKPDRFGLKRMGPVGDFEQFRTFGAVHDIYFPDLAYKDVFMVCGAEEIHDGAEDPSWTRRPICDHTYYSSKLGAVVQLGYRRTWLKDWQVLQAHAERLLQSFEFVNQRGDFDGSASKH
jgi:hypothetical protein